MTSVVGQSQIPLVEVVAEGGKKSFASVASFYVSTRKGFHKLVVRSPLYAIRWIDWCRIGLSQTGKQCKELLGQTSHVFYLMGLPDDLKKLNKAIVHLKKCLLTRSFRQLPFRFKNVYVQSALAADLLAESVSICEKQQLITLTPFQITLIKWTGFLGSTALFLQGCSGASKQFSKCMQAKKGSPEFKLALMRMAANTCLATIGFFGVVTFLFGAVIERVLYLLVSSLLLLFSLLAYFYDKLYVEKIPDQIQET